MIRQYSVPFGAERLQVFNSTHKEQNNSKFMYIERRTGEQENRRTGERENVFRRVSVHNDARKMTGNKNPA